MSGNNLPDKALAFHLFLLEYGEEQYNLGRVLSYEEMRTESLPIWNHLKKGEREEYKKNSILKKDEILKKNQIIHQNDSKIAQKKREKAIAKDQFIKEYLATKVKGCEDWESQTFIMADVNIFLMTKDNIFPAELALSKFSIRDGFSNSIHYHIDMDTNNGLPRGSLGAVKMSSEDTHRIPLSPDPREGKVDYIKQPEATRKIQDFLGTTSVLFTLQERNIKHDAIDAIERTFLKVFNMIVTAAPLQVLLKAMKCTNGDEYGLLINNPFDALSSIGCMHHYKVDAPLFCSLARVKRWVFQLCRLILPSNQLKPGKHVPKFDTTAEFKIQSIFVIDQAYDAVPIPETFIAWVSKASEQMKENEEKNVVKEPLALPPQENIVNKMKSISVKDKIVVKEPSKPLVLAPPQENVIMESIGVKEKNPVNARLSKGLEVESEPNEEYSEYDFSDYMNDTLGEEATCLLDETLVEDETDAITTAPSHLTETNLINDDEYGELDILDFIDDSTSYEKGSTLYAGSTYCDGKNSTTNAALNECSNMASEQYGEFDFSDFSDE